MIVNETALRGVTMAEEKKRNRGGAREGAGRPSKGAAAKTATLAFVCTEAQKQALKAAAKALGISQSEYICSRLFSEEIRNKIEI